MRKIIAIGESVLDTLFHHGKPVKAFVGGRIANAAASLATMGIPTSMVSECSTDCVGDIIVDFLKAHNVDVRSIDRYPDGATPLAAIFQGENGQRDSIVNYGNYPNDRFDVLWPTIDHDDIVLFGSLYSVDLPQRERLMDLVNYAVERGAIVVYLPGFQHGISFRITSVMPNVLENLEVASIIIAHDRDLQEIFPDETVEEAFVHHINFSGNAYVHLSDSAAPKLYRGTQRASHGTVSTDSHNRLGWQAGFTAGLLYALLLHDITRDNLAALDTDGWRQLLDCAVDCAQECAASSDNCVSADYATRAATRLRDALAQHQESSTTPQP